MIYTTHTGAVCCHIRIILLLPPLKPELPQVNFTSLESRSPLVKPRRQVTKGKNQQERATSALSLWHPTRGPF